MIGMKTGSELRRIRENKKLSQQEIADFLDIPQRSYSNMESGRSKISCEHLSKLSEFLDFDLFDKLQKQCFVLQQKRTLAQNKDIINNNYFEKLIIQHEARINELLEMNTMLKEKIEELKN